MYIVVVFLKSYYKIAEFEILYILLPQGIFSTLRNLLEPCSKGFNHNRFCSDYPKYLCQ